MADLGPLMCRRLHKYHHRAETLTIMPWAVVEPASIPEPDSAVRRELFGDAKLGILYSGTVGKAHNLQPFIQLARECRKQNLPVGFCFAGYGNRYDEELSGISTEDTNITRAGFVSEDKLQARLAAADIHMVSIADGWEGIVLPSKIFGALAMGRSLLYCGNQSGIVATLINQWHCGVVLDKNDIPAAVEQLKHFIDRPAGLQQANSAAFDCYHRNYSKSIGTKAWNNILKETSKTLGKIVTADIP